MMPSSKNSRSYPFFSRYILKENDEGVHNNNIFKIQEWWYYNALLNKTDNTLKNWTVAIALCRYPHTDAIKLVLHDNKKDNYGGIYLKPVGTCKSLGKNVNVKFDSSYAVGKYPEWQVYADNFGIDDDEFSVKLDYKANSRPMWILRNTGLNLSTSPYGYYCVMNCDTKGEISLKGKKYKVQGLGYHDHTWMPLLNQPDIEKKDRKIIDFNIWDWLGIHFDNGWDAFIGKIHSHQRFPISNLIPGSLTLTQDGEKLIECYYFNLKYLEFQKTSIPSLEIPKKIQIKALKINPFNKSFLLDIIYEMENIKECIPRDPPTWGQWEATGNVYGKYKTPKENIKLNGWGIMELTNHI